MTEIEACEALNKKYPDKEITQIWDYDDGHFVVEAINEDYDPFNFVQTLFGVDKEDGKVTGFASDPHHIALLQKKKRTIVGR